MARYCLDCGETARKDDQFCYYCGEPLPSDTGDTGVAQVETQHCTNCGAGIDSEDNYCYRCGTRQKGG